jgi:hypothetical protein
LVPQPTIALPDLLATVLTENFKVSHVILVYKNQIDGESGELYVLSSRINGKSVLNPYTAEKSTIQQTTEINTSWSVLNKKMISPPKTRKERYAIGSAVLQLPKKYASCPLQGQRMLAFGLASLGCTVPAESGRV